VYKCDHTTHPEKRTLDFSSHKKSFNNQNTPRAQQFPNTSGNKDANLTQNIMWSIVHHP